MTTLLLASALALVAAPAIAQDIASAEALFSEGRAAMERGDFATASEKLAASQRLDPSSGTLLNLAVSHAKLGKTASAWAEFLAAARLAQTQGNQARAEEARKQAKELEPKVSYLVVTMGARPQGLVIRRDDSPLDASVLGSRLPTDPGKHVLEASAPGFEPVKVEVVVPPDGASVPVTVPDMRQSPAKPSDAKAEPGARPTDAKAELGAKQAGPGARPAASPPNRVPALVVGGAGAAALAAGGVFGILALGAYGDAKDRCPTRKDCDATAMNLRDRAGTRATIANVGVGVGVVGLGVATALWLTAGPSVKREGSAGATVVPWVDATVAGIAAQGAF